MEVSDGTGVQTARGHICARCRNLQSSTSSGTCCKRMLRWKSNVELERSRCSTVIGAASRYALGPSISLSPHHLPPYPSTEPQLNFPTPQRFPQAQYHHAATCDTHKRCLPLSYPPLPSPFLTEYLAPSIPSYLKPTPTHRKTIFLKVPK